MKPRKKKSPHRTTRARRPVVTPEESRASLTVTVGWMLGALATFGAEVAGVVVNTIVVITESAPNWLRHVSEILFFVALMTGLMTLVMTPVCLKVRQVPPPRPITVLVVVVAAAPLLVIVVQTMRG
jgi:hypothetical protein